MLRLVHTCGVVHACWYGPPYIVLSRYSSPYLYEELLLGPCHHIGVSHPPKILECVLDRYCGREPLIPPPTFRPHTDCMRRAPIDEPQCLPCNGTHPGLSCCVEETTFTKDSDTAYVQFQLRARAFSPSFRGRVAAVMPLFQTCALLVGRGGSPGSVYNGNLSGSFVSA